MDIIWYNQVGSWVWWFFRIALVPSYTKRDIGVTLGRIKGLSDPEYRPNPTQPFKDQDTRLCFTSSDESCRVCTSLIVITFETSLGDATYKFLCFHLFYFIFIFTYLLLIINLLACFMCRSSSIISLKIYFLIYY